MRNSTMLNISIDGLKRFSSIYPKIDGINSINYEYDTYYSLLKVDFSCESKVTDLLSIMKVLVPKLPRKLKELRVNLNHEPIADAS